MSRPFPFLLAVALAFGNLGSSQTRAQDHAVLADPLPAPLQALQGVWEGVETGREKSGTCRLTVRGENMHFQGAGKDEWYKATFTLVEGAQPAQVRGKITECALPSMVGEVAPAIYKLEGTKLTLAGNAPGSPAAPKAFEGDPGSRKFVLEKVAPTAKDSTP